MAVAVILSGGSGVRLGGDVPKQYLKVGGKPVIGYCLDTFQQVPEIAGIYVVADPAWRKEILEYTRKGHIGKFAGFADAGASRQHSILNGLRRVREAGADDRTEVIIHDAARPCVTEEIIRDCIRVLAEYDCSMPVIPVKDTVYLSDDGKEITGLLNRDRVRAGQAPEGCHLGSYLAVNEQLADEELGAVRGTSAIAFEKGLTVGLFPGSEQNYKITTGRDLEQFQREVENQA